MKITATPANVAQVDADAVVVGLVQDQPPAGPAAEVDQATGGAISRLIQQQDLTGKPYELLPLMAPAGIQASQVLVVGLGTDEVDRGYAYRAAGAAARQLAGRQRGRVAFYLANGWTDELVESGICGAMVGCQGQDLYRAEKKRFGFEELLWAGASTTALQSGQIMGEAVNLARRLVNEPAQEIYPESFAAEAQSVAAAAGLEIDIWDRDRLEAARCGALLAVARGSSRPPRLVIVKHHGGGPAGPWLALVGKGVTFDSGGLSLKPSEGMKTMKLDMAGAATVLGAMQAIARLDIPINVVGLAGLVENMPGGESYKLGDVLTARSGRTIEVHNTDAEGRLVLADALSVALDQGAERIIDLATLTGACVVALGNDVAGLMSNDQSWCDTVAAAAEVCGEPAWQLPMFAEYGEQIQSEVADIKNMGEGRSGGAITAAKFLEEFVDETPWTHVDIAGPAFLEKPKPWQDAGGTGVFVRALVELARQWPRP